MKGKDGQENPWQGGVRRAAAELPIMELRQVGQGAASLLAVLHHAAFAGDEHWDEAAISQILAMPGVAGWLACIGDVAAGGQRPDSDPPGEVIPAGFIISRYAADEGEILSLGVHPHWRRRGLARKLLHHVVQRAHHDGVTLFLEVRFSNDAAVSLYEGEGFQQVAIRPRYYDDGEDARLLRCLP